MPDLRNFPSTGPSATTPPPASVTVDDVTVVAYLHAPSDGRTPYVVVEIDADKPLRPMRVYLNDGLVADLT